MLSEEGARCPYCFELVDTYPDPGGGEHQQYVEDCAVCCRPLVITATYDEARGEYQLSVVGDL
ncbi:MAG: CPXCG motif-containing cysteine-rich protein [Polyangiaceae bacterium]|nr:CPXCG motif-containing cysteine-rich protein [Polyangiaceae bacterium]MCB9606543.1 CPXCG motif-containing cysteine-rich protein [Polyangiaceae bacterium]